MKHLLTLLALALLMITGCKKETDTDPAPPPPGPVTLTDIDGNIYPTVKIGNQIWMAENLRVTRTPSGAALTLYAPNNDEAQVAVYGRLYHFADALAAVPAGWHLPTKEEWETLITSQGGAATAGAKLKHTDFSTAAGDANAGNNLSGMGIRGAGYRIISPVGGTNFFAFRAYTGFWTTNDVGGVSKTVYTLGVARVNVAEETYSPLMGFSVRLVKN